MKTIHDAFDAETRGPNQERLLLTAATAAGLSTVEDSYDLPELAHYLDFINLMSYDLHGSWDPQTGHNAGLYPASPGDTLNVQSAVEYYLSEGCPSKKLILGIGLYGSGWTLANANNN